MPALVNPRWEAFAQNRASGKSADEAYVGAGYKSHRGNAHRLSTNEDVLSRVAGIQARVAEKVEITVETLTVELEEARKLAIAEKQSSAAVSATMGKARLLGLEAPSKSVHIVASFNGLTEDELSFELASMINEVRAAAGKAPVELPALKDDAKH